MTIPVRTLRRLAWPSRALTLAFLLAVGVLFWPARALRSDNFVIYMPAARSVIPLQTIDQVKYLPLISVLNALGKVDALQEKRDTLKIWFGEAVIELRLADKKVRRHRHRLFRSAHGKIPPL